MSSQEPTIFVGGAQDDNTQNTHDPFEDIYWPEGSQDAISGLSDITGLEEFLADPFYLNDWVEQYRTVVRKDVEEEGSSGCSHTLSNSEPAVADVPQPNFDGDFPSDKPSEVEEDPFQYELGILEADIADDLWHEVTRITFTAAQSMPELANSTSVDSWPSTWNDVGVADHIPLFSLFNKHSTNEVENTKSGLVHHTDITPDIQIAEYTSRNSPYPLFLDYQGLGSHNETASHALYHSSPLHTSVTGNNNFAESPLQPVRESCKRSSSEYPGYPSSTDPLPPNLSLESVCKLYPNHVKGAGLRPFIINGWGGRQIYERLPEDARHTKAQRPWNYLQKALAAEEKRMASEAGVDRKPKRKRRAVSPTGTDADDPGFGEGNPRKKVKIQRTLPTMVAAAELIRGQTSTKADGGASENTSQHNFATRFSTLSIQDRNSTSVSTHSDTIIVAIESLSPAADDYLDLEAAIRNEIATHKMLLQRVIQQDPAPGAEPVQIWLKRYYNWQRFIEREHDVCLPPSPAATSLVEIAGASVVDKIDPLGLLALVYRKDHLAPDAFLNLEDQTEQRRLEREHCMHEFLREMHSWTALLMETLAPRGRDPQGG